MREACSRPAVLLAAAGVLAACASAPAATRVPGSFEEFARGQVQALHGGSYVRRITKLNVSADGKVACGTLVAAGSANVFAVILDQPFPTQTRAEVLTLPRFPARPDPETRERVGREYLSALRTIHATCLAAGASLS